MENKKKYRLNVAAVVVSSKYPLRCEIFIGKRMDTKDAWQFPQGGLDEGETPKEGLLRELEEEIGTNDVEFLAEYPDWISYDFPKAIVTKMRPFIGQTQKYFLVRLRSDEKVNVHTPKPEFDNHKFVSYKKVFKDIVFFKRPLYKKVLEHFKKEGFL